MYLAIRDDVIFAAGYSTLAEGLRDLDIPGIELVIGRDDTVAALTPENGKTRLNMTDPSDLKTLQAQAAACSARICALCMDNNFNAEDKAFEVAWAARAVRAARQLDAPAVRIDAIMSGERDMPLEKRYTLVADAVKRILEQTEDTGVDLGIENHGFQGNDPDFLQGLLNAVGSPRLGLTLDSGNFYWRGWPLSQVYAIFEQFAPCVKHTHIKNIQYPPEMRETQRAVGYEYEKYVCPIHEGDIDMARYFTTLRKAGYDRDICLEDESLGKYAMPQRQANLKAAADFFRVLI
jgi:sugar phosphate isomerase/epimerase